MLVNVAVLSGTVGVELQLVPVVHSAPGPCQVPSVACADVAASNAAAALVANKYARIPLAAPLRRCLTRLSIIHARGNAC